jgi:hypothetical protein
MSKRKPVSTTTAFSALQVNVNRVFDTYGDYPLDEVSSVGGPKDNEEAKIATAA